MLIDKVINNSLVRSFRGDKEVIVMGKGIGFNKQRGDKIDPDSIEKIYQLHNEKQIKQLSELLKSIELNHIKVANEIIEYAQLSLGKNLNSSIYISLTDHINFAIERHRSGQTIKNVLLLEISKFFPHEYAIGKVAIDIVEKRLGIKLVPDEAAFIAMHILNAELNHEYLSETNDMTQMIHNIMKIVSDYFDVELDENSIDFERFITHLKFFSVRVIGNTKFQGEDSQLEEMIKMQYPDEYNCALKIQKYIQAELKKEVTDSELIYLSIHIRRVRKVVE